MRVYGRTYDEYGHATWAVVQTDANGFNDYVYLTALIQEIKLNLGESPFHGNRGIPALPSVVQQVAPDYYTMRFQQYYAGQFMSLIISKTTGSDSLGNPAPAYRINVTTHYGVSEELTVPV